jgi:hypothetical protein
MELLQYSLCGALLTVESFVNCPRMQERLRSTSMVLDHVDPGASMGPLVRLQSLALDLICCCSLLLLLLKFIRLKKLIWSMGNPFAPLATGGWCFQQNSRAVDEPRTSCFGFKPHQVFILVDSLQYYR